MKQAFKAYHKLIHVVSLTIDLHAHSSFAGGSGGLSTKPSALQTSLKKAKERFLLADKNTKLKGVDVLGIGDVQFFPWLQFLEENVTEQEHGLFSYHESSVRYLLQTEIIFTTPIKNYRKSTHTVILFPNFKAVYAFREILQNHGAKIERVARPFVITQSPNDLATLLFEIQDIHPQIEIIPAHIMTPEGVYGGSKGVNFLADFYGDFADRIKIVETGLSADPLILSVIPELDHRTLISNSDAHSAQLHRVAREFTILRVQEISYKSIIQALRDNHVQFTFEFPPSEGRYFLTGHRAQRKKPGIHEKDQYCYFTPDQLPSGNECPICHYPLTPGVLQRAYEIARSQNRKPELTPKRVKKPFIHGVPLIEIIATTLGIKSLTSRKVLSYYSNILSIIGSEVNMWLQSLPSLEAQLQDINIPPQLRENILLVKQDLFAFSPPGYDGQYGSLVFGKKPQYAGIRVVHGLPKNATYNLTLD